MPNKLQKKRHLDSRASILTRTTGPTPIKSENVPARSQESSAAKEHWSLRLSEIGTSGRTVSVQVDFASSILERGCPRPDTVGLTRIRQDRGMTNRPCQADRAPQESPTDSDHAPVTRVHFTDQFLLRKPELTRRKSSGDVPFLPALGDSRRWGRFMLEIST